MPSQTPYCYEGTTVLKNIPGLRAQLELDAFEAISTAARASLPLPSGRFSVTQYRAIHRHLFQDVYERAGKRLDDLAMNFMRQTDIVVSYCVGHVIEKTGDAVQFVDMLSV